MRFTLLALASFTLATLGSLAGCKTAPATEPLPGLTARCVPAASVEANRPMAITSVPTMGNTL